MDNKLRQGLLDELDKIKDMVREETPIQPEPQAGDVWETDVGLIVFIHENRATGSLSYTFRDGGRVLNAEGRIKEGGITRIFSLSEYLKGKE